MKTATRFAVLGMLAGLTALPALAQASHYAVHSVDFDIWCTEIQRYSWDRCDKRSPEDLQKFEDYRRIVERYEIPYLQERDQTLRFNENVMRNDPVDKRPDSTLTHPPGATDAP